MIKTYESYADMMKDAANGLIAAKISNLTIAQVDIPLPVTGGTELDDWPGGIKQMYSTIRPLITEVLATLNFSTDAINVRNYLGGENGMEDAVGLWEDNGYIVCCFPTVDTIPYLIDIEKSNKLSNTILVLINQKFCLNPLSTQQSKTFLASIPDCYRFESLNMRGPGVLPIRALLCRQYPYPYLAGRRLDRGGYITLQTFDTKPDISTLQNLFFEDSIERDKTLTFFDRIKPVGSKNPVKINSVMLGFQKLFNPLTCDIKGYDVKSDVPDQPFGDEITKNGSINRALNCYLEYQNVTGLKADLAVGLEGGVEDKASGLECFAWITVYDGVQFSSSRTASFVLPPIIRRLVVEDGMELGDADDKVFKKTNSKQAGGMVGQLTKGVINRTEYYEQAVILALIPFLWNELYSKALEPSPSKTILIEMEASEMKE